jgi:hypothetical protein
MSGGYTGHAAVNGVRSLQAEVDETKHCSSGYAEEPEVSRRRDCLRRSCPDVQGDSRHGSICGEG